jgi:hypothetical protein
MREKTPFPPAEGIEKTFGQPDEILDQWLKTTFGKTEQEIKEAGRKSRSEAEAAEREYRREEDRRQN